MPITFLNVSKFLYHDKKVVMKELIRLFVSALVIMSMQGAEQNQSLYILDQISNVNGELLSTFDNDDQEASLEYNMPFFGPSYPVQNDSLNELGYFLKIKEYKDKKGRSWIFPDDQLKKLAEQGDQAAVEVLQERFDDKKRRAKEYRDCAREKKENLAIRLKFLNTQNDMLSKELVFLKNQKIKLSRLVQEKQSRSLLTTKKMDLLVAAAVGASQEEVNNV